ncbi:hypothetical protein PsYK624_115630 [Phanerochaete sordida]|uniref:Uncharacterized protein n=1 Tax=Phanerochaete sordida TaxID=48140 RepID=A0A9P3LI75_9APHY|nr:hypothetical protein PsYK624_115630 [Phanerochaete sordida]
MNSHDLQKNTLQPVTRDLWNFLLECSQRNTGHKANILLTHDSIKLLLVLTRQCISVALRVLPDDWIWLAQVLQDAEQSGLILSDTADPQETIPALARQALDALVPIIADAAPQLRMALAQLAALRVPPTTEPTTTTWWHGPVQMVRRFGSRVANVMSRRLPDAGCHPAAMEEGASYDVFPTRVPALPTASAGALPSADQASRTPTPIHAIPDSGSITNILRSNDYPTSAESSTDKGTANRGDSSSPSFLPDTTPPLAT